MDYVRRSHSKSLLIFHLILVCKYRKPLLVKYGNSIKSIFQEIAIENDTKIIEMEVDRDHIHVLIEYLPKRSVLEIVRSYKQVSTYRIWRQEGNWSALKREYWKENTFWSDGYFACSIGNVSKETIEKYIQSQG